MLETTGLSNGLAASSAELLAEIAMFQDYDDNDTLFREGEQHSQLFWIASGRVRLEMSRKHAGAKAMLTVGEGDLLAWSALLGDGRMTATATTTAPTRLIAFDAAKLLEVCEANHDIGYKVMTTIAKLVSKRLVATRLQLLDLFHQNPTHQNDPASGSAS